VSKTGGVAPGEVTSQHDHRAGAGGNDQHPGADHDGVGRSCAIGGRAVSSSSRRLAFPASSSRCCALVASGNLRSSFQRIRSCTQGDVPTQCGQTRLCCGAPQTARLLLPTQNQQQNTQSHQENRHGATSSPTGFQDVAARPHSDAAFVRAQAR